MAVLVEGISVVLQLSVIASRFPGGTDALIRAAPNDTLCADNEIVRIGFMVPNDAREYVRSLEAFGIIFKEHDTAIDLVVVDQRSGPTTRCDWIEFGHVNLDGDESKRIAVCRRAGSTMSQVFTPENWKFEQSLSASFGFVPIQHADKSLKFIRNENGVDVYFNSLTGKEVFIGRTSAG